MKNKSFLFIFVLLFLLLILLPIQGMAYTYQEEATLNKISVNILLDKTRSIQRQIKIYQKEKYDKTKAMEEKLYKEFEDVKKEKDRSKRREALIHYTDSYKNALQNYSKIEKKPLTKGIKKIIYYVNFLKEKEDLGFYSNHDDTIFLLGEIVWVCAFLIIYGLIVHLLLDYAKKERQAKKRGY